MSLCVIFKDTLFGYLLIVFLVTKYVLWLLSLITKNYTTIKKTDLSLLLQHLLAQSKRYRVNDMETL